MRRKTKGIVTVVSAALTMLVSAQMPGLEGRLFCSCSPHSAFDYSLPMSHPVNRCAAQQAPGVSWSRWFAGQSSSYQFHFLDLLELLSRSSEEPKRDPHG